MGTRQWPGVAALVLLVLASASHTEAGTCRAGGCPKSGGNGLFKYEAGHTYVYNLEGKSISDLPEQQGDGVKVELKAVAEVHFGADCTNTLKLKGVQVTGPTAKKYGNLKDLEKHATRFIFSDGHIDTELCAENDDGHTALNIKRAVISLLQVATPHSVGLASKHETDVFGSCPTSFSFSNRASGETHVTKARNLNKCSHREDLRSRVSSTPYFGYSELQSFPLLDSSLAVDLSIKNGIVETSESRETYFFRPFANKEAGAKTVVVTRLTLASHGAGAPHAVSAASASKSLIFDAPHGDAVVKSNGGVIVAALQAAGAAMPDNVGREAATEFRHLVEVMRHSGKDDLLTVYGQVKAGAGFGDKVAARKVFMDALFRARTGDSVQVAVELLKSNEISSDRARLWYTNFAFTRHTTLASLTAAASLLDEASTTREAYLGVGSLAGRYCRQHDCQGVKQFDDLLARLARPLAKGCKCANHEEEDNIIAALKGLENVKQLNEATAELLRVCVSDASVPARVRVVALEAFRADACQPQLKKTARELLLNRQEDSEIRIKAYLAAVECPCGKSANALKELLDSEPVNQVGSYIVSHLRHLRASHNPDKALAKRHLSEVRTTKHFPVDVRRYSFNRELSYFLDAVNVGSSVEQNVIYSQQSYLPRSTSLNLTTEIFGHSFNLLELSSRAENLDRVVEKYFGPKGVFRTHDLEELLTTGKANLQGLREKLHERLKQTTRSKRSVPQNKLEEFRKQVTLANDHRDVDIDLNLKMFGSHLATRSFHSDAERLSPASLIDRLFDRVDAKVEGLKNFNINAKEHGIFFETELAYPTGLGFPLKLAVSASAAVHLKLDGKIDLHAILKDPKNAHVQFEIVPSAVVEVLGEMTLDAHAVEAGVKVTALLHSATGVNVDIKRVDGSGFDVSVGLPIKKQEIVDFKTEVVQSVQEKGQAPVETAVAFNTKRKEYHGCFDQLSPLVGLTFCGDVAVPFDGVLSKAALFPLNGPSKVLLTVESDDVTTYKFRGVANVKDPDNRSLQLLVDTPGSKTNRKLEVLLECNRKPNRELRASLKSPYKDASAELVVVDNDKELSLSAKVVNDKDEYVVRIGTEITGNDAHQTYTPLFEYSSPTHKSGPKKSGKKGGKLAEYNVEGSMVVDKEGHSKKFTFNNVVFTAPAGKVSINGYVAHDPDSISSDLQLKHNEAGSLDVKGKLQKLGSAHYKADVDVHASQYPDMGVSLKWDWNRGKDQLETNLVLVHGSDPASTESKLTAHALAKYRIADRRDYDLSFKSKLSYPLLKIDGKLDGNASPKSVGYDLEGIYEAYSVSSVFSAKRGIKAPGDYAVEFEAKVLDSSVKFETRRDIISPTENKLHTSLDIQPGGKYELTADVTCKNEPNDVLHRIVAVAKIAGKPEPFKLDAGVEATGAVFGVHAKASVGSVDHVDVLAKLNRAPNPSGNFKILLKDRVDGQGQFKYVNGEGSLAATVDLKKMNRKIKASGDIKVTGSNHVVNFDLFFDADKDPSRKIHVASTSDLRQGFIDSKNTLIVLDYKAVLNLKGELTGTRTDGNVKGSADLTLPSGREITLKVDRDLHVHAGDTSMHYKIDLGTTPKGGAPVSLAIVAKGDKIDLKHAVFDTELNLVYTNAAGKDCNYYALAKSLGEKGNRNIEFKGHVKGSLLELTPLVHVTVAVARPVVTYMVKLNLDTDSNLLLNGKVQMSDDQKLPVLEENDLELNLPTGELKHIKLVESWSLVGGHDGAPIHLKGFVSSTLNKEKSLRFDVDLSASKEGGSGKLIITGPKNEPRTIEGSFKIDKSAGVVREGSLNYKHLDKESHVDVKIQVPETKDAIHVTISGRSPLERLRTVNIVFHGSRQNRVVSTETTVVVNDKTSVVTTKYSADPRNPIIELGVVHPKGKSLFAFNVHRRETKDDEFTAALNIEHGGNALAAKIEARVPSAHDFEIKIDLDSERLKLNKLHIVLANQPSGGGKTVSVTATEDGVNIVSGDVNYHFEDGSNEVLFEAKGNLKIRDETKPVELGYKRAILDSGVAGMFLLSVGERKFESIYKRTNRGMEVKANMCKDTNKCGIARYIIEFSVDGSELHREAEVHVDMTALDRDTYFLLKTKSERTEKHLLLSAELTTKTKEVYKYKFEVTDKAASVVLETPQREVAAEANYHLTVDPANRRHISYKMDATACLDRKRQPDVKTSILLEHDYLRTDDSITFNCLSKFQHPSLGKDMVVKAKTVIGGRQVFDSLVEIDVFAKKGQKIVIDSKILKSELGNGYNFTAVLDIKSKGQNLDIVLESHAARSPGVAGFGAMLAYKDDKQGKKELGFGYQRTLGKLAIFAKSPKEMLLSVDASCKMDNNLPSMEAEIAVMGKALIAEARVEKHKLITSVYKKESPERKVQGLYQFELATKVVAQSEWVLGAEKKELYNIELSLGKQAKPELSYSLDNIKELLEYLRKEISAVLEPLRAASKDLAANAATELTELIDGLKKAQPNLKPLLAAYQAQLKAIRAEVDADKAIAELAGVIREFIGMATTSLSHVTEVAAKVAEKALDMFEQLTEALLASLKRIVPVVTQSISKITQVSIDLCNTLLNQLLIGLQRLVELIKRNEADFKQVLTAVAEVTRDVVGVVGRTVEQIYIEVKDFIAVFTDQIRALPMFGMIQERIQELREQLKDYKAPEPLLEALREITQSLKEVLPTEELKEFVSAVSAYVQKVLSKSEKVDDVAELKAIYHKLCAALRSVVALVRSEVGVKDREGLLGHVFPTSLQPLLRLPLAAAAHFSPLDFLRSDDRPSLKELLLTYRPRLNPLDFIPPFNSYGILIGTSHFFTLDGRHYTFSGSCSYVLAQDAVNGNFSVVLNTDNGKFKSIQVSDATDTVEFLASQGLLLNGKPYEFPLHHNDMSAWRRYDSANIKSKSGVSVKIDGDHHFAVFHISGFYHGQVRGLLGDLNNEQYDDFRMPNGKVTEDVAEFGNSYAVGPQCAPGTAALHAHSHHAHHESECTQLFSANSPLRHAFPIVDPTPFREACDHYASETADKKSEHACRIAAAYAEAAHAEGLHFIHVPNSCAHCTAAGKVVPVGETVSVKSTKEADIIFIMEEVTSNAEVFMELVRPLVDLLHKELKEKGFKSVDMSLLGYGHPNMSWPQHYTSNGKLSFDDKTVVEFGDDPKVPAQRTTRREKLQYIKHRLQVETGRVMVRDAMMEALRYPFRAGAARAIVLVESSRCEKSILPLGGFQKLRLLLLEKMLRDRGITFHVVSSLDGFNVAGSKDAKQLKAIVGFDKNSVYSLRDSKKKVLEGNDDLRSDIEHSEDVCVESAQATDGAIFNSNNFLEGNAGQRRQFLTVLSHRLVESLSDELTEDCSCVIRHSVHAQMSCQVTARKHSAQHVAGKGKKGTPKN